MKPASASWNLSVKPYADPAIASRITWGREASVTQCCIMASSLFHCGMSLSSREHFAERMRPFYDWPTPAGLVRDSTVATYKLYVFIACMQALLSSAGVMRACALKSIGGEYRSPCYSRESASKRLTRDIQSWSVMKSSMAGTYTSDWRWRFISSFRRSVSTTRHLK